MCFISTLKTNAYLSEYTLKIMTQIIVIVPRLGETRQHIVL